MQLQMQDIIAFSSFYETVKNQKVSVKTAYKMAQLAKAVDSQLEFYREKLQNIIQEYGEKDKSGAPVPTEDGEGIKLKPGTETACYEAMKDLQELEVELPDIGFTIEEFDNVEMSIMEFSAILPFIKD